MVSDLDVTRSDSDGKVTEVAMTAIMTEPTEYQDRVLASFCGLPVSDETDDRPKQQ